MMSAYLSRINCVDTAFTFGVTSILIIEHVCSGSVTPATRSIRQPCSPKVAPTTIPGAARHHRLPRDRTHLHGTDATVRGRVRGPWCERARPSSGVSPAGMGRVFFDRRFRFRDTGTRYAKTAPRGLSAVGFASAHFAKNPAGQCAKGKAGARSTYHLKQRGSFVCEPHTGEHRDGFVRTDTSTGPCICREDRWSRHQECAVRSGRIRQFQELVGTAILVPIEGERRSPWIAHHQHCRKFERRGRHDNHQRFSESIQGVLYSSWWNQDLLPLLDF
jgi:hypothetical protein